MVARSQKEIRQRAPWWLVGLLFVNLVMMTVDARDEATKQRMVRVWSQALASPAQRMTTWIGGSGVGLFQWFANLRHASSENESLKKRVVEMESALRDSQKNAEENARLRSLLQLKGTSPYTMVAATVIARDPSVWFDSIEINKGRSDGVEINMPVVTADGLVGRVVATSPWTAQVMLITDDRAAVGSVIGQLGQSTSIGPVKGSGKNGIVEMRYVSGLQEVKVGEIVTTTGQDGIFPPGLVVGEVFQVKAGSATVPLTIYMKPAARLDSLIEVAVLQYRPPPRVTSDQALPNVEKTKK
jgi:rod shape-determining protein MreC